MNKQSKRAASAQGRDRRPALAATALMVCSGLLASTPGVTQELAEGAVLSKGALTAPAPTGKGPMQMTISMAPTPAAGAPKAVAGPLRGPSCVGAVHSERNVVVPLGKSVLVPVDEPVRNRTLGNPEIAQATMVSPQTLYLVGQSVGTTNMIVQGRSGACQVIDVIVSADAGGLQAALGQLMPEERDIRVSTAADNLVLAGRVSSAQAAAQAVEIARAFGVSKEGSSNQKANGGVLNMLSVDTPQQVMLEVKVAEVDKTLLDQLGSAVNIQGGFGSWQGALVSNLLAGASSALGFSKANNLPLKFAIDAQKTDQLVKILAEPNLVTISGQEATFLAGGEVFIPVPQSSGSGATAITLQEQEFGVGLKFTPTVLSNGHINLRVAPEVSELSPTGVTLTAANVSGQTILPLITTRRASTTVQMADGESFAIGGLIRNNVTGSLKALPGLGEIPVLGALLRSTSFQQDRTELVFIITPHLVKPVKSLAQLPMPTDSFTQPNEADVYATGNMEGRAARNTGRFAPPPAAAPATPAAPGTAPQNDNPLPAPQTPAQLPAPVPAAPAAPATPAAPTGPTAAAPATPPAATPTAPPAPTAAAPDAANSGEPTRRLASATGAGHDEPADAAHAAGAQ